MDDTRDLQQLLTRLEQEFSDLLMPMLEKAANGHDAWLFMREATALQFGLGSRHGAQAEATAIRAEEIVGLREDLKLDDPSCAAVRFLQCCKEAADTETEKKLGPQRTAQNLLNELNRHRG